MQIEGKEVKAVNQVKLNLADKWILNELNMLIESVDKKFEKYDIGMAESELSDFFWTKFCDWYIELSKTDMQGENSEATIATLAHVLTTLLKLLHPFIPFITEKIYLELPYHEESIMISVWPQKIENYKTDSENMEKVIAIIKAIRNARAEKNLPDNKKIKGVILTTANDALYMQSAEYIKKLSLLSELDFVKNENELPANAVKLVFNDCRVVLPLDSMVDATAEKARMVKEIEKVKFEIARSEKMLSNQGFVAKAPQSLIDNEKTKLEKNKALLEKLENDIKTL